MSLNGITTRLCLATVLGVSVIATGTVLWRHYSGLVDAKAELTAKAAQLEVTLVGEKARSASLEKQITVWSGASEVQAKALDSLARAQLESTAYQRELKREQSKHDLAALAKERPALVEGHINAGTARVLSLLEHASHAPANSDAGPATTSPSTPITSASKP